eukprot:3674288-Rhodomonas_salina.1
MEVGEAGRRKLRAELARRRGELFANKPVLQALPDDASRKFVAAVSCVLINRDQGRGFQSGKPIEGSKNLRKVQDLGPDAVHATGGEARA